MFSDFIGFVVPIVLVGILAIVACVFGMKLGFYLVWSV